MTTGSVPLQDDSTPVAFQFLPYWIASVGLAAEQWESVRVAFLDDFALPYLRTPPSPSKFVSRLHIELVYRSIIERVVVLCPGEDSPIWSTLFASLPISTASHTQHKLKKPTSSSDATYLPFELAKWALEELEKSSKPVLDVLGAARTSNFVNMCIEYVQRSPEEAPHRSEVALLILPKILRRRDAVRVWHLVLSMFKLPSLDHDSLHMEPIVLNIDGEEERLVFEMLVRFCPLLYQANDSSNTSKSTVLNNSHKDLELHGIEDEKFDVRESPLFFSHLLFRGITSSDPFLRKRSIYVLKRLTTSSATEVTSSWWRSESGGSGSSSADSNLGLMQQYLLLQDTLDDHDVNIMKAMWPLFLQILDSSSPDLLHSPNAQIYDGFIKCFIRRCLWTCDSKPLKKWMLAWTLNGPPHRSILRMCANDIYFTLDLLKEIPDIIGDRWSRLEVGKPVDTESLPSIPTQAPTNGDIISPSSFQSFFLQILSSNAFVDGGKVDQEATRSSSFLRSLVARALQDTTVPASTMCSIFLFLSSSKQSVMEMRWPMPIFDSNLVTQLLNSLQSTFMGYTAAYQYVAFKASLQSLRQHMDETDDSLKSLLLLLLTSIPTYFASLPDLQKIVTSFITYLATISVSSPSNAGSASLADNWLSNHFRGQIQSFYDPRTQIASVMRSTVVLHSFDNALEAMEMLMRILCRAESHLAINLLSAMIDVLVDHWEHNQLMGIVLLASMAKNISESLSPALWSTFLSRNLFDFLKRSIPTLSTMLLQRIALSTSIEGLERINRALDLFQALSSLTSLLPSLSVLNIDTTLLETSIISIQSQWTQEMDYAARLSTIGAFLNCKPELIRQHPSSSLVKMIDHLLACHLPLSVPNGLDGPTWKFLALKFESSRWKALDAVTSAVDMMRIVSDYPHMLESYLENAIERSESCHMDDVPIMMRNVRVLLSLLSHEKVDVGADVLSGWVQRLERALRQEKTFWSRQVYHFIASVLNPSVLSLDKYSEVVLGFMNDVMKWSESSVGIANWLVRVLETSLLSIRDTAKDPPSNEDLQRIGIRLIPVLFRLAVFGPVRNSGSHAPTNTDLSWVGFDLPSSEELVLAEDQAIGGGQGQESGFLCDSQVRASLVSLVALLFRGCPLFHTRFLLYVLGYTMSLPSSEVGLWEATSEFPAVSRLNAYFLSQYPVYAHQHTRKDSYSHHLNYRRFQLLPFLSMEAIPSETLFRVLWPLFELDHLASVLEMLTLSSSLMIWRILGSDDVLAQEKLMRKLRETLSSNLPSLQHGAHEDTLFSWLTLAGFTLLQVDFQRHARVLQEWKHVFLLLLPFLTYNTLYIRGTAQEIFLSIVKDKETQLTFLSNDFVDWLMDVKLFITNLYIAKPLNKIHRRETFYADFINTFGKRGTHNTAVKTALLNTVFCQHPTQHELTQSEMVHQHMLRYDVTRMAKKCLPEGQECDLEWEKESVRKSGEISAKFGESLGTSKLQNNTSPHTQSSTPSSSSSSLYSSSLSSSASSLTFQRKILPWQSMDLSDGLLMKNQKKMQSISSNTLTAPSKTPSLPATLEMQRIDSNLSSTSVYGVNRRARQEIIVVASLLKKLPNLGGLTRTCEVFGASKLVLPSMAVIADKTFQDLSVSAQHWLPMEEVPEDQLPSYLEMMRSGVGVEKSNPAERSSNAEKSSREVSLSSSKSNSSSSSSSSSYSSSSAASGGYTIIGLEQTSTSKPLQTFEFPERSLLILGDEKHGIPVHLLQVLDATVEIPQLGLIRSLNVHVSASICVWEYTKQHMPK